MFGRDAPTEAAGSTRASARARFAFTLVEMLAVMAIVGILVGLTLPAVNASRESGRNLTCKNHLRQIGLAFLSHHAKHGCFPSGGWDFWAPPSYRDGLPQLGEEQGAGWGFQILPYLDAEALWSGSGASSDTERTVLAISVPQPVFFCPTRRRPQTVTYRDPHYIDGRELRHALCDYAGSNREGTGAVRRYRGVNSAEIRDGVAHTLLVGDKRLNLSYLGAWQEDDNEGYTGGWDEDTIRRTDEPPWPDFHGEGTGDLRFGSSHPGLLNFVFCDGAVHSVLYSIDPKLFERLGDRADGEAIALGSTIQ
jgi:prepilin-type N-terminal cleavage/methylation domain-containing protein/prepilin-type processing-associated H-X9-DG protein